MVFRFATIDLTENIDDCPPPFFSLSPPSSPTCFPLGKSFTRAITVAGRFADGVSSGFSASAAENSSRRKNKSSAAEGLNPPVALQPQLQLRSFMFHELEMATGNFSESNVVGEGGYGKVYRGVLFDGSVVAIKRYRKQRFQVPFQLRPEVQVGSMTRHRNLVPLIGFCDTTEAQKGYKKRKTRKEPEEFLLVYQYFRKGSVDSYLRAHPQSLPLLNWPTRLHIALGVARGLSYLHQSCNLQIIHRDIKPSNILLDEYFEPFIADFGLAKFMNHKHRGPRLQKPKKTDTAVQMTEDKNRGESKSDLTTRDDLEDLVHTSRICGTYGYMAPEILMRGDFSAKSDVFAFGMVLLELVSARSLHGSCQIKPELTEVKHAFEWVKNLVEHKNLDSLTDKRLEGDYDENEVEKVVKLALLCTQSTPSKRPKMSEVVQFLEGVSLNERWECQKEGLTFEIQPHNASIYSIITPCDSELSSKLQVQELSGPR